MKLHEALRVVGNVGVHPVENAKFVRMLGELRVKFGNFQPALSVLVKLPGRLQKFSGTELLQLFPIIFGQGWLVVKGIDVRRAAAHAGEDYPLGPGGEMGALGIERVAIGPGSHGAQAGEGQVAETGAHGLQRMPPGKVQFFDVHV